ncbi:hypothetical protein CDQ83_06540 [Clostridium thermosuccinogenes]|nr:hypothetical protein CDQ83_06540 [Pseudoclostridium thermosuccinogenes]
MKRMGLFMEDFMKNASYIIDQHGSYWKGFDFRLRCIILAVSVICSFTSEVRIFTGYGTFILSAVFFLYWLLSVLYLTKSKGNFKKALRVVSYFDIAMISFLCYCTGGIGSDGYVVYFFIIGIIGIQNSPAPTIKASIFAAVTYTLAALLSKSVMEMKDFWRLGLRVFYIFALCAAVLRIYREIRKYEELHKREFKLARTDKLTGLANRRYFEQKLAEEARYSDASGKPVNILIFDIDNFKKFNDTYGHIFGDKLLELFADIIKKNIRKSDIPIRYGGEEFLILIRDLDKKTARNVAERIRSQLEKQCIVLVDSTNESKMMTVSCGLSQYPEDSKDISEVVKFADMALYRAKQTGKNTVVSYDEINNKV